MSTATPRRNHAAWIGPLVGLIGLLTYFMVAVNFPYFRDTAIVNLALVVVGLVIAAWGVWKHRSWRTLTGFGAAAAFAVGTLPKRDGLQGLSGPGPGHFHQAQRGNAVDL